MRGNSWNAEDCGAAYDGVELLKKRREIVSPEEVDE